MKTNKKHPVIYFALNTDHYYHRLYSIIRLGIVNKFSTNQETINLIEPARLNWSLEEWREKWPDILQTLDVLVVWPRLDFTIGRGCHTEILDCQQNGIAVWIVSHEGDFYNSFDLDLLNVSSFRFWARIILDRKGLDHG